MDRRIPYLPFAFTRERVTFSPQIDGTVQRVLVREGDRNNLTIHNYYASPQFKEIYYYAHNIIKGQLSIVH